MINCTEYGVLTTASTQHDGRDRRVRGTELRTPHTINATRVHTMPGLES